MSLPLVAILPVKAPAQAKSRLAAVLAPAERERLCRALHRRTLAVVAAASPIARVIVVSADRAILAEAASAGAMALPEAAGEGFNGAARRGVASLPAAAAAVVIPTDLPLLETADLEAALPAPAALPAVALAADRHGEGTNLMALWPARAIGFAFGPGSFAAHREAARAAGIVPRLLAVPALGFDLDTPADWQALRVMRPDLAAALVAPPG